MNSLRGRFVLDLEKGPATVLLNLNALRICCEADGIELGELLEQVTKDPVKAMPRLVWAGVENHSHYTGEAHGWTFEQFAAQLGSLDFATITDQVNTALGVNDETEGKGEGAKAPNP